MPNIPLRCLRQADCLIELDTMVLDRLGIAHELGTPVKIQWMADFVSKEVRTSTFTLCGFWEANENSYASMAWVSREFADQAVEDIGGPNPETRIGSHSVQVSLCHD